MIGLPAARTAFGIVFVILQNSRSISAVRRLPMTVRAAVIHLLTHSGTEDIVTCRFAALFIRSNSKRRFVGFLNDR